MIPMVIENLVMKKKQTLSLFETKIVQQKYYAMNIKVYIRKFDILHFECTTLSRYDLLKQKLLNFD